MPPDNTGDHVPKTPKALRLAAALQSARKKAGLTLRELATLVERDPGGLSRYETGDRTPKPEVVAQLLTAMGVRGSGFDEIMTLAYDTDAPGWVAWTLPAQRQHLAAVVDAEQKARSIEVVAPSLFPGLLQEKSYMQAIMSGGGVPADEVVTRVAVRLGRRDVLHKRDDPARLVAYVGEAALYWLVGGARVMAAQLRYALEQCDRPNIRVHVIPFRSGWQPALEGAFMILDASVVHMENRKSGVFLHENDDVTSYVDAVDKVRNVSCGEAESAAILAARADELEKVE
jgi:hypothetical protein